MANFFKKLFGKSEEKVETNTSVLGFASSIEIVEFGVFGKLQLQLVT